MPQIQVGAEVYYFPGMGRADKLASLCIDGTDIILIEMPFDQWTQDILNEIRNVLTRQKLRVVLAHVERYPEFQRDRQIWDQVMRLPLTLQVNAGSFLKSRGKRKFCLNLLKDHENVILGSDCHNLRNRVPNLEEARKVIVRKLGQQRTELLDDTVMRLLDGDKRNGADETK